MEKAAVEPRGIYLDIKGFRDRPPIVLGIAVGETFEQVVTDADFGDAALAKDLRFNRFEDEVQALVVRCRRESRRIFAFSRQILHAIEHFAPSAAAVMDLYEDARELALLWHEKSRRGAEPDWSLADFLADLERPQPRLLAPKHTSSRLRYVEQQLRKHGAYDAITGGAKAKWTKLLQQNESDTRGTRELVLHAARELTCR